MQEFKYSKWIGLRPNMFLEDRERVWQENQRLQGQIDVLPGTLFFRKTFSVPKPIQSITLYIAGVGICRAKVNGLDTDDSVLFPVMTDYRKGVLYDQRDITGLIVQGRNCITIEAGGGYYAAQAKYWDWRLCWLGDPCIDVRLDICYMDGTSEYVGSNHDWKVCTGAVTFCCIYDGETYDARIPQRKWEQPEFDDSAWSDAIVVSAPCTCLYPHKAPKIKVCAQNAPIHADWRSECEVVFDFGQNCTGWVDIAVSGRCGDQVTIHYAERIHEDGSLDDTSNRHACNTDTYVLNGEVQERYQPGFTFHGFRYAQVRLSTPEIRIHEIRQSHVHSNVKEIGTFSCNHANLMKLHRACLLTQRNALLGVPLDCPQRDERLGWLGDAYVTSQSCLYNFDMRTFYESWIRDIAWTGDENGDISHVAPHSNRAEAGSPEFSSGLHVLLWNNFRFYGDKALLSAYYGAAKRYVEFLMAQFQDGLLPKGRYGDWKSLVPGFVRGDPPYATSLFMLMDVRLQAEFAQILGYAEDVQKYTAVAAQLKKALLTQYYDPEHKRFGSDSQFTLSFALLLGVIPQEDEQVVLTRLIGDIEAHQDHLTTGIFGTKFLMEALRKYGRQDVILRLMTQTSAPSWLDMLKNNTTLTETWDGNDQSLNHTMFGSVESQLYQALAGIEVDHTKEAVITIKPYVDEIVGHLYASVNTQYGLTSISIKKQERHVTIKVELPDHVPTQLILPDGTVFHDIHGSTQFDL